MDMKCIVGCILLAVCSGAVGAAPIAAAQAASSAAAPQETAPEGGATAEPGLPDLLVELVVTATREPRPPSDVPAAVTIIRRSEIERSPAKTLDELLPSVPSFGLFRRSSSLVADPTSQGLNLRGIGPSGVSRGLMLVDGVPVNDPFGGWIYWSSLPRLGIEQLEIVPGGASALYGSSALGGVVQIVSRRIADELEAQAEAGAPGMVSFAGLAGHRWGGTAAALEGEFLSTDGYFVVPEATRGAIDRHASANHGTASGRFELAPLPWLTLFARGGFFAERQNGGTEFTTGSVNRGGVVLGGTMRTGELGSLDLRLFGHAQRFEQDRTRILPDPTTRASEVLAARQGVPTQDQGLSLSWAGRGLAALGTHSLLLGAGLRQIKGRSNEDLFPAPVFPHHRDPARRWRHAAAGRRLCTGRIRRLKERAAPGDGALRSLAQPRCGPGRTPECRRDLGNPLPGPDCPRHQPKSRPARPACTLADLARVGLRVISRTDAERAVQAIPGRHCAHGRQREPHPRDAARARSRRRARFCARMERPRHRVLELAR